MICETVLEPKLATSATPVASLTATPMGLVPTVTSATASFAFTRSRTDAVPAPLLATTAKPRCWLMAMPCGVAPTGMVLGKAAEIGFVIVPKVGLAGLMSIMDTLLHPLLVTIAMGENGPFLS